MKNWLTVAFVVAASLNVYSQEKGQFAPSFFRGSLTEANELALKEEKKFVVMLYENEDDKLVKYFMDEVFSDSALVQLLNESFITFYEQKESDNAKNLIKQFGVDRFPIILFVSTQGELMHRIVYKLEPDQMIDELYRKVIND